MTEYSDTDIKLLMLEYISKMYFDKPHVIALEARYGHSSRRADILLITTSTHAFEIKSDIDNLTRLPDQMHDYRRTFDKVTVVTTARHRAKIKKIASPNDGIMIIKDNVVYEERIASINGNITKKNLISICSKKSLSNRLGLSGSCRTLNELRKLSEKKLSLNEIKLVATKELVERFKGRYQQFCSETYPPFRESDLIILKYGSTLFSGNILQNP